MREMSYNGNEDRLSHMPEGILSHILSSMPTKSAVRTSILSSNWRYKWTLVTHLDFEDNLPVDDASNSSFSRFVNRALKLCKTSKLERFRLCLTHYPDDLQTTTKTKSIVSNWVNKAVVELNVSEVDLHLSPFELPHSLFSCKTLTKLSLSGWGIEDFIAPDVSITLPLLKSLHVTAPLTLPGLVTVNVFRLIHACPLLENLSIDIGMCTSQEDYKFNIPTLKRLRIKIISYMSFNTVFLNLPNLEYLEVDGLLPSLFLFIDVPSLVEARVRLSDIHDDLSLLYTELLQGISGAKSISWSSPTLDVLLESPLPKFPNLEKLKLEGSLQSRSVLLFGQLKTCSKLEHLCFQEPEESCWNKRQFVPTWMLPNLKTMEITKCKGRKCDMQFIQYVLGNSEGLKKLTVACESLSMEDEKELCQRLSTFSRASENCQVYFCGKWLLNIFDHSTVFYLPFP